MSVRAVVAVALVSCLLLQGCASSTSPFAGIRINVSERLKAINRSAEPGTRAAGAPSLDDQFQTTLRECKAALVGFDQKADRLSWFQFGIAMVGAIAGSVIGPYFVAIDAARHAGLIAAMSGTAGVANTAQISLAHVGLSTDLHREARADLRREALEALAEFQGTDEQKRAALTKATVACALLPGVSAQASE